MIVKKLSEGRSSFPTPISRSIEPVNPATSLTGGSLIDSFIRFGLIAFLLFGVYGTVGYTLALVVSREKNSITNDSKSNTKESKRTAATEGLIAMAYVNNILVAVFAEQFFGIQSAVLPALYNIPYYIGIIILKKLFSVQPHRVKN